ncbi:putative nepenthesin [Helianthus annuus]|uniref:Nepenthesin n=2 Tax=cellular organisms TaxID=131567 RepID=A0A251TLH3_HELAN|nr:protein ASPARTIC PROTEASE IN GUARD CELL 1 [Helianthus annuus]KAF5803731.1 putative nepenthesin [Helianthus annuus]KAJ0561642.1 putative nepenthesin [Helianthus annuus]KAJ0568371.1 putative nepenthesin [Helianthus annuus]KAJ0574706.1 putative nepenthesin [Helianthus annuus]KAJ0739037.1 putative nepenthesin [Helianthus annuus]
MSEDCHVTTQFFVHKNHRLSQLTHNQKPDMISFFFFLFLFLSLLSCSHSTTAIASTITTNTLDVASSVQKTLDLLNPTFLQKQSEKTQTETKTTSLSFTLHPRSSVHHNQHYHDYESLTLARLARDSHRVTSLITKLNFAISGTNISETNPVYKADTLTTPVTSGLSQRSGEYFARVGLGTPAQSYYMTIDTGSDLTWLQCKPCSNCYQQTDPIYDPSGSSSYNVLPCTSEQCESLDTSACESNTCLYQVSYGDESFTVGDFVTETVSFNSGSFPSVAVGCGHDNEGLFAAAAGLLGLGRHPLSFPSQIKSTSFSYCLVDRDSANVSTLDFNSVPPANSVTVPLLQNPKMKSFYYVGLTGISVGERPLPIPPSIFAIDGSGKGGAVVDSGTAVTRLHTQAYNSLRDEFTQQGSSLKRTNGYGLFDTCFDFSEMTSVKVPEVAFIFAGGKTLSLRPENYLVKVDSSGKFCLAFAPTADALSIIGSIQQQGTRVGYDMGNSVVSFSPNDC